jgi:Anti-sigma-K factor rskA/Putative zinc-finger
MTHEEWQELTALYVLDALDSETAAQVRAHLQTCPECRTEMASLQPIAMGLLQAAPVRQPPADLRRRVIAAATASHALQPGAVQRPARWTRSERFATAAALLLAAAGVVLFVRVEWQLAHTNAALERARVEAIQAQTEARDARNQLAQASASLTILTSPDVMQVDLKGQVPAPSAAARAYWSRSRGLVFNASHLPPAPRQKGYQLWVVTAQAPISVGMLRVNAAGDVAMTFHTPPDIPPPVAIAVTVEPEGGVPAPTGDKYLVGVPAAAPH